MIDTTANTATTGMTTAIAAVRNLRAYYITDAYGVRRTVKAVDNVSIAVRPNEIFGIAGESGCGKSTLLKVMLGMVEPPLTVLEGMVGYAFDGRIIDVLAMTDAEHEQIRWREVSYIPQGSMHVLNPVRKVHDTFLDFVTVHHRAPRAEVEVMIRNYLRDLGLPLQVLASYPHQLSGGMKQRVTIALATILWPKLIFADEPTTALDVVVQRGVIQLLREIQQRERNTLVVVTHDMGVHANLCDRVAVLYAGQVIEEAGTQAIFRDPRHPYTQYLIRSLPKMDDRSERVSIPGRPPALDNPPAGCRFHPRCPEARPICRETAPRLATIGIDHRVACYLAPGKDDDGD
jgi:peptide/nickel transport system ATP-binding protein